MKKLLFLFFAFAFVASVNAQCTSQTFNHFTVGNAYSVELNVTSPVHPADEQTFVAQNSVWTSNSQAVPSLAGCDCWQSYYYFAPTTYSYGPCQSNHISVGCMRVVLIQNNLQQSGSWTGILMWHSSEPYSTNLPTMSYGNYVLATVNVTSAQTVTITDNSLGGCGTTSFVLQPELAGYINQQVVGCNAVQLTVVSVSATSYLWSTGETTSSITASPGINTVTLTDTTTNQSTYVNTYVSFSTLSVGISGSTNLQCTSGSTDLTAFTQGGMYGFSYTWSNGSTGQTALGIQNPGDYTVTVTDGIGCTSSETITITRTNNLVASIPDSAFANCLNNQATVLMSQNTGQLAYQWSTGNYGSQSQSLSHILPVGTHTVTMTRGWCVIVDTITVQQAPNPTIIASASTTFSCNPQLINLSASGGIMGGYLWSNGVSANTTNVYVLDNTTYSVTGTNLYGCTASGTISITVSNLLAQMLIPDTLCVGQTYQPIVTVTGGTTPYTYNWSNSSNGTYIATTGYNLALVTITDANGCTTTTYDGQNARAVPTATIVTSTPPCGSGNVFVNLTTGSQINYLWSNGATTQDINVFVTQDTILGVLLTNAFGCTASFNVTINPRQLPQFTLNPTPETCNLSGFILAQPYSDYHYLWNIGQTGGLISPAQPGTYTVTVTASNGCTATGSTIIAPLVMEYDTGWAYTYETVLIEDTTTETVSVESLGSAPCALLDSTTTTTTTTVVERVILVTTTETTIENVTCGGITTFVTYDTVVVSTSFDTAVTITVSVDMIPNPPVITFVAISSTTATVVVTGGTEPYTYQWSNGATAAQTVVDPNTTYTVTVTDATGCSVTTTISTPVVATEVTDAPSVVVYPNPTTGFVYIDGINNQEYLITDAVGKTIIQGRGDSGITIIDLSGYPAGLYLVLIEGMSPHKIVKH
jgi:hypothetical protein